MAKVTVDLGALSGVADAAAERGLQTALLVGQRRLQADILNRQGEGRASKRGKKAQHRASAPGAPPAPDTGSLRARTQADQVIARDGDALVGRIVANTNYAEALEKGTERIAARPFMSTLATDHKDELAQAFAAGAKG